LIVQLDGSEPLLLLVDSVVLASIKTSLATFDPAVRIYQPLILLDH